MCAVTLVDAYQVRLLLVGSIVKVRVQKLSLHYPEAYEFLKVMNVYFEPRDMIHTTSFHSKANLAGIEQHMWASPAAPPPPHLHFTVTHLRLQR
ncbi:hypothetical protein AKJ16_DCAP18078 [Drosera capensis]